MDLLNCVITKEIFIYHVNIEVFFHIISFISKDIGKLEVLKPKNLDEFLVPTPPFFTTRGEFLWVLVNKLGPFLF